MLLTAGYPYYIVYGLILFSLYFIFIVLLNFQQKKENQTKENLIIFLKCIIPSILAFILASPWLFKIKELMKITRDRNLNDINFSLSGSSNITDQLGSWVFPPVANTEGWYYFGIVITLLIIFLFFSNLKKNKVENKYLFFFLALFVIVYQFSASQSSLIFSFIWTKIDFIQNFRFWVRSNIILVPIISILIAFSLEKFEIYFNDIHYYKISKPIIIISIFIILLQIYLIYFSNYKNDYWEIWQYKRFEYAANILPEYLAWIFKLYNKFIYSLFLILFVLIIFFTQSSSRLFNYIKQKKIILFIILGLVFSEIFILSNLQWAIPYGYYDKGFNKYDLSINYNKANKNAISDLYKALMSPSLSIEKTGSGRQQGNTYYRNNKSFNINYFNHWGIAKHTFLFDKYFNFNGTFKSSISDTEREKVKFFYGMNANPQRVFFSSSIDFKNIPKYVDNVKSNNLSSNVDIKIKDYNGDKIIIIINSKVNGWISFIDNWSPGWVANINDKKVNIFKLLGTYKSVKIVKGNSIIKMEYKPFSNY